MEGAGNQNTSLDMTSTVVDGKGLERDGSEPPPVIRWVAINKPHDTGEHIPTPNSCPDPPVPLNDQPTGHTGTSENPMPKAPVSRGGNCQFCDKHVTRNSSLKRHYSVHVNTPLKDPEDRVVLANILQKKHYTYNICPICQCYYNRLGELKAHVDRHEANAEADAAGGDAGPRSKYGPTLGRKVADQDRQNIIDGMVREGLARLRIRGTTPSKRKREEEGPDAPRLDVAVDNSGRQPRRARAKTDKTGGPPRAMGPNSLQADDTNDDAGVSTSVDALAISSMSPPRQNSPGNSDSQHDGGGREGQRLQEKDAHTFDGTSGSALHDSSKSTTDPASHLQNDKSVESVPEDGASQGGLKPLVSQGTEQVSSG